ncbi:hypothetical protein [Ferrovibrio sp.]|uniref:hypothetical protein n=1 Tax=Ferrovibrio sp. TaxID=1917215 RepID=UPI0035118805
MDSRHPASPACSLDEAPDGYRGYLPPAEIAAAVRAMAARAGQTGRERLAAGLAAIADGLPPAAAPATAMPDDLAAAFDALLPRIRDNALHARLKALRDAG